MSSSVLNIGEEPVMSQAQYVGRDMGTEQVTVIQRAVGAEKRRRLPLLVKRLNPASIPRQGEGNMSEAKGRAGVQAQR